MTDVDGNKYAIDQHLYSLEDAVSAEGILDKLSNLDVMYFAQEWDIYIKDDKGEWVDEGFESLLVKIEENLDTFIADYYG